MTGLIEGLDLTVLMAANLASTAVYEASRSRSQLSFYM